ncbi:sodium-dependent bicarbonate transport family permease [Aeromicrobium sp. REDSEA-S38_B2]|uniref:sodium-dependent bicarbonate transport family permease n=1 Tax=Aeromicrobium sp. REDSEA-S38_B2 TaxID=1811528 RepID=UPI000A64637F|nr:sodium-dependent bicarbonate transport family permease [Aeromicrobium sp. REDSEA-S38_B2]
MDLSMLSNLTDPVILFFVLGLLAGTLRSNLEVPPAVTKFLSLYLLMSIGFKGGEALAATGITSTALTVMGLAVLLSVVIPVVGYRVLRRRVAPFDAAAIAATYGSVSAVTFVAATQFVTSRGDEPGGYMTVALVMMETPAVIMAVLLATPTSDLPPAGASVGSILRGAFTEGTFLLLVGSLVIGVASGSSGAETMAPLLHDLFKGLLAFFLLDMGLVVARQLREVKGVPPFLIGFAVVMPLLGATLALALGVLAGLSVGDLTLLTVLAASGSYIVVPAVARHAIPEALPSRYLTMSLGITFPFNIVLGIPLYHAIAGVLA